MTECVRTAPFELPIDGKLYRFQGLVTSWSWSPMFPVDFTRRPEEVPELKSLSVTVESTGPVTMVSVARRRRRRQQAIVPRPADFWCHR